MAYDYNNIKKQYESLNDEQKKQFEEMNKNDTSWNYQKFMTQYNQEKNTATPTSNESNFNNGNDKNYQNSTQTPTINKTENQTFWKTEFDENEQLDKTMFNEAPWKITVKEWTAQQTGKPDYQLSSEARLNEMKGNLDQYFKESPRMFNDRETFNKVFEYNTRESEAQRQLLDSYWKRKEDMDKASTYTSWESINTWMKNWEITTDQLNLLKEYNPEAYQKWQQLQEDEIKKRIVNDIVPPLLSEISSNITEMMSNLWLDPQDALDIEWVYNDTMDSTWAWKTLEDANNTVNEIKAVTDKKTEIMNRYSQSTWWTASDALQAARMAKALAPYNEQLQGLQYQYQDYANLYKQKLATATQAANVRQAQAQENQRVWNQRYQALGFAMNALSYRTPEQQAQLRLQEQQASNEMNLLYQSKLQDLNRYNQYATAKMQNQLQAELTDLNVEDENQLRANLNNVLSDYYKNYWDIIQRSQAQTVEDIIKYAKEHGISVAQALTENFIKPLQNKAEYKQKVASDYGMLSKQTITTINWKSVIMTTNPNWSISYKYIEDPENYVKGSAKKYNQVDSRALNSTLINIWWYTGKTLGGFLNEAGNKEWDTGWQCWHFVNNYLQYIWVTDANNRYYDDNLSTKLNSVNTDIPTVWSVAVFDYNHKSSDWINHGHVAIVTDVDDTGFWVIDSNYDVNKPWKIEKRHIPFWTSSCKWFFDPSQAPSAVVSNSSSDLDTFEWRGNTYNLSAYSGWNDLTDIEKETVISLLTYQTDPSTLPKSWKDNWVSNTRVRAAASAIGREHGYDEKQYYLIKNIEKTWDDKAEKWDISRNATSVSILKNLADSYSDLNNWDIKKINQWINNIKTEFGDKTTLSVASNMVVAAEEIAWALKWWASPSEQDTQRILDLFNGNLSNEQAQQLFKDFAKNLLDKNMTEADRFAKRTWYKPDSIYTDEVSDRLHNDLWLTDLAKYYDYTPINSNTSWPDDPIQAIWEDDYEDTYGLSYSDVYHLVNG